MMETLKCFECKIEKPLKKFKNNNRTYQLKSSKGKCLVCQLCSLEKALDTLSVIRVDKETNKFISIKFKNAAELIDFFEKENGEL